MSTPVNYYLAIARGALPNALNITAATVTLGTYGDVELRMQINYGTSTTGLKKEDVLYALEAFKQYILSNGLTSGNLGTDLPAN